MKTKISSKHSNFSAPLVRLRFITAKFTNSFVQTFESYVSSKFPNDPQEKWGKRKVVEGYENIVLF